MDCPSAEEEEEFRLPSPIESLDDDFATSFYSEGGTPIALPPHTAFLSPEEKFEAVHIPVGTEGGSSSIHDVFQFESATAASHKIMPSIDLGDPDYTRTKLTVTKDVATDILRSGIVTPAQLAAIRQSDSITVTEKREEAVPSTIVSAARSQERTVARDTCSFDQAIEAMKIQFNVKRKPTFGHGSAHHLEQVAGRHKDAITKQDIADTLRAMGVNHTQADLKRVMELAVTIEGKGAGGR